LSGSDNTPENIPLSSYRTKDLSEYGLHMPSNVPDGVPVPTPYTSNREKSFLTLMNEPGEDRSKYNQQTIELMKKKEQPIGCSS